MWFDYFSQFLLISDPSTFVGEICVTMISLGSILRFCKLWYFVPIKSSLWGYKSSETPNVCEKQASETQDKYRKDEGVVSHVDKTLEKPKKKNNRQPKSWRCIDNCFWIIGYLCTTWWVLVFLSDIFPVHLPVLKGPEIPGTRLKREGLIAHHPVVLVPGIITGGLELWQGKPCAEPLFRKRLWGGGFTQIFKRYE